VGTGVGWVNIELKCQIQVPSQLCPGANLGWVSDGEGARWIGLQPVFLH
jgi:hypothetical protein